MTRGARVGPCTLLATLALGAIGAPSWGQPPQPGKAAPAKPADEERRRGVEGGHLWWNDSEVSEKLALTTEQRSKMDALYRRYADGTGTRNELAADRKGFETALRQGDLARARSLLDEWADAEDAAVRGLGTLRIEVLSLLDAEQRKKLAMLKPDFVATSWDPRPSWVYRSFQPRTAPAKRPAPAPAKAPAKAP